jgi:arylsulfatase A-like enzyme
MKSSFRRLGVFAVIVALGAPALAPAATSRARPNVILIFSDDHGFTDLGAQGVDRDIQTPHLDALAREGVRFARGYVTAPQCVPSRAGVITGRYQQRFGVDDNLKGPLPLAAVTIAERLKPAGYVSGQVGKWHLEPTGRTENAAPAGGERGFLPGDQGFDDYYTGPMNSFVASHDLKGNRLPNAPQRLNDPRFRCVWQTDAAVSFIERHAREPFFLYLAYYTPHVPLESPEPWFSRTPTHLPLQRRQALAMIAAMDDGIGRVRATLRSRGSSRTRSSSSSATTAPRSAPPRGTARSISRIPAKRACSPTAARACRSSLPGPARFPPAMSTSRPSFPSTSPPRPPPSPVCPPIRRSTA